MTRHIQVTQSRLDWPWKLKIRRNDEAAGLPDSNQEVGGETGMYAVIACDSNLLELQHFGICGAGRMEHKDSIEVGMAA